MALTFWRDALSSALSLNGEERSQTTKRTTRYDYTAGPMKYLGQQIVKTMEDSGRPCFIWCHHRPAEQQQREFDDGDSKARPWSSPHQYLCAVDLLHPVLYWNASPDYWRSLNAAVKVVEEKFNVPLTHGFEWGWDSAHVELDDWEALAACIKPETPTRIQLCEQFEYLMPTQWKSFLKTKAGDKYTEDLQTVERLNDIAASFKDDAYKYPHKPKP